MAIGAVRDSNIIAHAQNAGITYEQEKDKEESILKDYEDLLATGKTGKSYKYADVENNNIDQLIVITSDNKFMLTYNGTVMYQGEVTSADDSWTITNSNMKIGKIVNIYVDGQLLTMLGFTEDGKKVYMVNNDSDIDETAKTITFEEEFWFELNNDITLTPFLTGDMWGIRGLTAAKQDVVYKGLVNGMLITFTVESSGGFKMYQEGEGERVFDTAEVSELIANDEIQIINNNIISMYEGSTQYKFVNDGKELQIIDSGETLVTLTLDFVYEEIDFTDAKTRIYMSSDGTSGIMLKENGEYLFISNNQVGSAGLKYEIHSNITLNINGVDKTYKYLFYGENGTGGYSYGGSFSDYGRKLYIWQTTGESEDGLSFNFVQVIAEYTLDETKSESDFTVIESE